MCGDTTSVKEKNKRCVNHRIELIDFNRRILNQKLLTVTEQNGTATLSKTQRVHNMAVLTCSRARL